MSLRLVITSNVVGASREVEVGPGRTTLGRGAACKVILDDPDKLVSREHAAIDARDGAYHLVVTSKVNPVLVNDQRLNPGQTTQLKDGDVLRIDPFVLTARISGGAAAAKAAPADIFGQTQTMLPDQWFNLTGQGKAAPASDPFGLGDLVPAPQPERAPEHDPFRMDRAPEQDNGLVSGLGGLDGPSTDDLLKSLTPTSADPLVAMITGAPTAPPDVFSAGPAGSAQSIDDILGGGPSRDVFGFGGASSPMPAPAPTPARGTGAGLLVDFGGHVNEGSGHQDHVHDINLPLQSGGIGSFPTAFPSSGDAGGAAFPIAEPTLPPSQAAPAVPDPFAGLEDLIPGAPKAPPPSPGGDSIDAFLAGLGDLKPAPAAPPAAVPVAPAGSVVDFDLGADAASDATSIHEVPTIPKGPPVSPIDMPVLASSAIPQPGARARSVAPAAPAAPAPVAAAPAPGIDTAVALEAFLRGLGMPALKVPPDQQQKFLEMAGGISRAAIEGVMSLLLARAELKKELKADDRTMIAARENNPLKIMDDPAEALQFLFDPAGGGGGAYLPPVQAVDDACQDIRAHELALVAGVRAAVEGSIKRFAPANFEQILDKKGSKIMLNRSAKLWDTFVEYYAKLDEDLADNLDRIFERDFLKAYVGQVRTLRPPKR